MTEDEKKEIMAGLATSPDFLMALSVSEDNIPDNKEVHLSHIALYFFSKGYISRMEFEESKKFVTRPYIHKSKTD